MDRQQIEIEWLLEARSRTEPDWHNIGLVFCVAKFLFWLEIVSIEGSCTAGNRRVRRNSTQFTHQLSAEERICRAMMTQVSQRRSRTNQWLTAGDGLKPFSGASSLSLGSWLASCA